MRERERRGQRERERLLSDYDERVSGSSDPPPIYIYICALRDCNSGQRATFLQGHFRKSVLQSKGELLHFPLCIKLKGLCGMQKFSLGLFQTLSCRLFKI